MSSPVSASFDISRPTGQCHATGSAIEPGSPYVATLSDDPETGKTRRLDFDPEAWRSGARPERPLMLFATWRATMPERGAPSSLLATGELVDVFEQLVLGDEGPEVDDGGDPRSDAQTGPDGSGPDGSGDPDQPDNGATGDARAALRYLLALALLRKRALVLDSQRPASREAPGLLRVRRWTRAGEPTADILEVAEPRISEERLAELAVMFADIVDPGGDA